jgi:signal transduction histidine kinase
MSLTTQNNTIMVVDDKPSNLRLLEKMLSEKGYCVRIFPKGALALKSALKDPPDLILLDINMPEMSGYEVCQCLKGHANTKDLPVIFISALTETTDKIKAFNLGGVDYITKPFQVEEVHARISLHLALRRTKAALEEKNQILLQTLNDLKTAQHQLVQSEKMAALGVLVAGIAHEINNPINFIKSSILGLRQDFEDLEELLNAYEEYNLEYKNINIINDLNEIKTIIDFETLKSEIPQLIRNIYQGVSRTEEIINSLRYYSRMDRANTEKVELCDLINAALVILKNRYRRRIQVKKKYAELPELSVHPGKLIQVLINILSNAIDAVDTDSTPFKKKRITLETSRQYSNGTDYAVISISDNGPGIPKEIQNNIFDPFFTTKEVGTGTGLGLSISIGIIKEHQGMIKFSTACECGTTFSIFLPLEGEGRNSILN